MQISSILKGILAVSVVSKAFNIYGFQKGQFLTRFHLDRHKFQNNYILSSGIMTATRSTRAKKQSTVVKSSCADNGISKVAKIQQEIREFKDFKPESMTRFFKVGKGDYAEHEKFLGVSNPSIRKLANVYVDTDDVTLQDIQELLYSEFNEERCLALVMLVGMFEKLLKAHEVLLKNVDVAESDEMKENLGKQKEIFDFYLRNTRYINNWNLVDISACQIIGVYLLDKAVSEQEGTLHLLARSTSLWERRISIVSTLAFIRQEQFAHTLTISQMLFEDGEDLIHKATGWMLREMGKRKVAVLRECLAAQAQLMPKTMLRYAIEKLPATEQKKYLRQHQEHQQQLQGKGGK